MQSNPPAIPEASYAALHLPDAIAIAVGSILGIEVLLGVTPVEFSLKLGNPSSPAGRLTFRLLHKLWRHQIEQMQQIQAEEETKTDPINV